MDSLVYLSAADTSAIVTTSSLDSSEIIYSVIISDTVKVIDVADFIYQPSFYLSFTTLILAIVTLLIPWLSKRSNKRKKITRFTKFVMHLLRELSNSIELRIPKMTTLTSNIRDIQSGSIAYDIPLLHPANTISEIEKQKLYEFFINAKKSKDELDFIHYKSINDTIEFFIKHDDSGRINFERFMDALKRYESELKENLDNILLSFDNFVAENKRENISISTDEFLKTTADIIIPWRLDDTPFDYLIYRDRFLIPLQRHAVANIVDSRATDILDSIKKSNSALDNIINIREVYGDLFDDVVSKMNKRKEALDKAIIHFSYLVK